MTYYDPNFEKRRQQILGGKVSPITSSSSSSSGSSFVDPAFQQRRTQILSTPSKKVSTTSTVKVAQPKKVQTQPNLIQQAGDVANKIIGSATKEVKNIISPEKKIISPVASPLVAKKLPSSGLKLTLVDSNQNPSAQTKTNKQTLSVQKKQVDKINNTSDNIQKFFDAIGKPINQGVNTLSKGVVSNQNQVMPRQEYKSDAEYKKALTVSKQESQGKFSTSAQINRLLGQAIVKTVETSSLGIIQGDVIPKNKLEEVSSQIATYAPLVGVPVGLLARMYVVSTVFDTAFNKITGKKQISELLPNNTPQYVKTGVDLLEFLGKALVSHGIKAGKIRDTFIRKTVEDKGIPTSYYMSAKEVQDVVIGKNTGYQKDILSKLNMTSSEWRKAVKTGAQVEIPTSTIVTVTDRPYWSKLKGMFGIAPTDPKVTVVSPQPKVTNIAGLISPGEYTPEEIQQKIINGPLKNTEDGKVLMKESIQAQQQGKNMHIGDLPKEIADALNQTQIESARKQIRVKEDSAYKNSIEKKSTQELYNEPLKLRDKYISKFGNVVNPDLARTLSTDYKGVNSSSLDNFGIGLKNIVYNHLLETGKTRTNSNDTVLWTGGGPGSTKSTSLNNVPQVERNKYVAIVDSTFSPNSSFDNVKKALNKGYKAETLFTLSDPFDSWKRVINRALDKNSIDYNRVVSEEYFINAHEKARDNIVKTYEKFKDNPNYKGVFLKKFGSDASTPTTIDFVRNYKYNADTLRRQINEYTDKLKSEGKISEELYKGFTSDRVREDVGKSKQESTATSNSPKQTSEVNSSKDNYKNYSVTVNGVKIPVRVDKNWNNSKDTNHPTTHIEFDSNKTPNPISETGYKSHFIQQDLSKMSESEFQKELQGLADNLAKENKPIKKPSTLPSSGKKEVPQPQKYDLVKEKAIELFKAEKGNFKIIDFTSSMGNPGKKIVILDKVTGKYIDGPQRTGANALTDLEKVIDNWLNERIDMTKATGITWMQKAEGIINPEVAKQQEANQINQEISKKQYYKEQYARKKYLNNPTVENAKKWKAIRDEVPQNVTETPYTLKLEGQTLDVTKQDIIDRIESKPSEALRNYNGGGLFIKLAPIDYVKIDPLLRQQPGFRNRNKFPVTVSESVPPELQKRFIALRDEATAQVKEGKFELKKTTKGFDAVMPNGIIAEFQKTEREAVSRPIIGKTELKTLLSGSNEFSKNPVLTVKRTPKDELVLAFEGDKLKFNVAPEAMGLNVDNVSTLPIDTKIKVDEASLKGTAQQMRVYKNGQVFASVGDYADIKNRTKEIQNAPIVEFPELVKIAKELMGRPVDIGYPRFRPTLGGRPNGLFSARGDGKIILNPNIFSKPGQAAKTLAHELGHLADYLPEKTMKRGNLLGRIASLNHYLKTLLKESPDSEFELITLKERAKIRAMAQKEGKNNYETITHEIEVGKEPTNPEEILSIWRDNTASINNPELNAYIAGLSDERKKEIVVAAMRNKIPDWVTFMHTVKETVTEKVLKNSPQDIKALYKKMLKEEILKRRLFDLETIKKELSILSQKWKPFNANLAPEGLVLYRQQPSELYADAISVLFNDPAMLKEQAPTFWKAFFNYADQKPEVHNAIRNTWDLLNKGEEAVFEQRQKDVEQMFDNSEQQFTAKNLEKIKEKTNFAYTLKLLFNNVNEPIIRKVNQAKKEGKTILDAQNPIYPYEGMAYMDGKLENFVQENFQPIFAKSQEMSSDGWQKLGSVLLYERSMNERGELANPLGFDPKTAGDQLRGLEKSMKPEDWKTLQDTLKLFRKANEKILKMAEDSEFYTPELLTQMKANKSYATYQVIDYLDTYVSAHVSKSIGTLKEIANPATSTVMKGISVVKAIERNNAKKTAVKFFQDNFPDEITPAKSVYMGKGRRQFIEAQDSNQKMIKLIENGKMTAYYVEKDLADLINSQQNNTIIKTAKIARVLTGAGVYRPLFTSLNLGFSTFNFVRDFQRYWINVPDYTLLDAMTSFPRAIYRYGQAVPTAARRARGKSDKTITEMKGLNILGATYRGVFEHNEVNPEDQQIERIMKNFGLMDAGKKRTILTPFIKVLDSIDGFNNFIETLPKVAGYNELKGKGRMTPQQLADFIRNDVGSPNFRTRGQITPISNSILLFSNAIKEGIKSDVQVAAGKKGKQSAGGFWWKTIASTMLPTMLMFAGSIGLLGKWYEDRMKDVSEYDKTNFTIIPTGVDTDGKTTYLRVPRAETQRFIGGLLWKIMHNASRKDLRLEDVFDVFDYGAGQLPNVTPLWSGVGATITYLSGKNPYDPFRNRNVIPDTEFKAGYKYSLPKFVDWLSKNQGAGIMLPSYVPTDPTALQKALSYPFVSNVVGRWLKSSDYGQTEANTRINQNIDREKAQQNLDNRDKLDKALKEYKSGPLTTERRIAIEKQLIKDTIGDVRTSEDKTKRTNLIKKFKIALIRGNSDPLTNSIIDANTNDAKVQIILNAKDTLGSDYKSYVNNLYKQKVISVNVIKILKSKK